MEKSKKYMEFPDCWEELTQSEWEYLLKLRYKLIVQKGITLDDVKREWCRFVLHGRGIKTSSKVDYYLLIYNLSLSLGWMWSENETGEQVALTFESTQNLLPKWKNLVGPLSHGSDLTFAEFRVGVSLMNSYAQTQDAQALQALCGLLYRRPGKRVGKADFDGHYREPFNEARMAFYTKRASMIPAHIQWGIYAWFAYFCEFLMTGEFIIEGNEVTFAPLFKKNKSGDDSAPKPRNEQNLGMNGILFSVAKDGLFGNVKATDDTLLLKVMLKLLDDYQQAKALSSKYKKK